MQPSRPVETGLNRAPGAALQQPTTWHAELQRHATSDEFGLVEPALVSALTARRCPCDDIDVVGANPFGEQPVDQEPGEVVRQLTAIPILEAQQYIAGAPGEGHCGDHLTCDRQGHGCRQSESARPAQHRADPVTTSTSSLKQHAREHDEWV